MNEDARLERALRDVLDARDPGPAPRTLRERVDHVPEQVPVTRRGRRQAARRAAGWLAAAAAVLVVLGLGSTLLRPLSGTWPGQAGSTPAPSGIDPLLQTGIGVVDPPNQVLVVGIVVLVTLGAFYGSTLLTGRKSGILAVLVVLIPGAFLVTQVLPPPNGTGGASGEGTVPGSTLGIPPGDRETLYVTAPPGQPYAVALAIRNSGPVPLRLEGMVATAWSGVDDRPSLWFDEQAPDGFSRPGDPFRPITLGPGEETILWLVQRADTCSIGPALDPALSGVGSVRDQQAIVMRWSVLGIVPREDAVQLSYYVTSPLRDDCTD